MWERRGTKFSSPVAVPLFSSRLIYLLAHALSLELRSQGARIVFTCRGGVGRIRRFLSLESRRIGIDRRSSG